MKEVRFFGLLFLGQYVVLKDMPSFLYVKLMVILILH